MHWSQFIHKNWKQTFERKLVYTLGIPVRDMVLDNYFLQIASLIFSGDFDVFDVTPFPSVSVANFEHLFVVSKDTWLQTVYQQKRKSIWNFSWNFSIADIFRGYCWNSELALFKEYLSMTDSNGYFSAYHVAFENSLPYW